MKKFKQWFAERNINYKKYIVLFYIIFVMSPILIVMSINDRGENVFARTLASVLLLVFFVLFFIYDYRKKLADDWGLKSFYVDSDGYKHIASSLQNAKNIKAAISFDTESVFEVIEANMRRQGCKCEILLLNPYSEYVLTCGEQEKYAACADKFERLASASDNEIDIKYYSLMPINNLFIIDDNVFVYPMTQSLSEGRRLVKEYRGKKTAYNNYNKYFRKTWEHPIYETDNGGTDGEKE